MVFSFSRVLITSLVNVGVCVRLNACVFLVENMIGTFDVKTLRLSKCLFLAV